MTWAELVDRTILQFGTNPHNKAIARKFLEEAERDLAYYTKCYVKDQSIIVNALDNTMELPNDFLEFKSAVQYNDVILETFRQQMNRLNRSGEPHTGEPLYYLVAGGEMILIPHPSADGVVNFQYLAQPQSASNETYYKINYKQLDNGFFQKGTQIKGATSGATGIVHNDENDLKRGVLTLKNVVKGADVVTSNRYTISFNSKGNANKNRSSNTFGISSSGQVNINQLPSSGTFTDTVGLGISINFTGFSNEVFTGVSGIPDTGVADDVPLTMDRVIETTTPGTNFVQNENIQTIDDAFNLALTNQTLSQINANWDEYGLSARAVASSDMFLWGDQERNMPQIPTPYHIYLVDYAKSCVAENEKEFELADRFMKRYYDNRELVRQQVSGKGTGSGQMVVADIILKNEV